MTCNCSDNFCNIKKSNEFDYIIEELKKTRDNIDKTIDLLESRIKKDSIIEEILSTDYDDEEEEEKSGLTDEEIEDIIKFISVVKPTYYNAYKPQSLYVPPYRRIRDPFIY